MADSKKDTKKSKDSNEKPAAKTGQEAEPGYMIKASDPLAERILAIYLSMLEDAGHKEKAKHVKKAHGKVKGYDKTQ